MEELTRNILCTDELGFDEKDWERGKSAESEQQAGKECQKEAVIIDTGKNLVVDRFMIDTLGEKELNRQLDYHRAEEQKLKKLVLTNGENESIPLKSHMRSQEIRREASKRAVERYLFRQYNRNEIAVAAIGEPEQINNDIFYESDYYDDTA
ncbi:hypothetical protein BDQ17DRAFT_1426813 [Cyathus striatus]|nr:hypothetical protein BDQ17DRAFT_1426813 [Cyathus striatus]